MNSRLPQPEAGSNLFRDRLNWNTTLHMAVRALRRNKLRSTLTILGITIGIGAVICTVAIGQGGSQMIHNQLEGLGTNMVWIEAGARSVMACKPATCRPKASESTTPKPSRTRFYWSQVLHPTSTDRCRLSTAIKTGPRTTAGFRPSISALGVGRFPKKHC